MDRIIRSILTIMVLSSVHCKQLLEDQRFLPVIPEECLDKNFCENVPNYPEELASKLISELDENGIQIQNTAKSIHYEDYYNFNEEALCIVEQSKVTPEAARDSNGTWQFVLNTKKKKLQTFIEIKCKSDPRTNEPINRCSKYLYFTGADSYCEQKYRNLRLQTINKYAILQWKTFRIRCCCSCEARRKISKP